MCFQKHTSQTLSLTNSLSINTQRERVGLLFSWEHNSPCASELFTIIFRGGWQRCGDHKIVLYCQRGVNFNVLSSFFLFPLPSFLFSISLPSVDLSSYLTPFAAPFLCSPPLLPPLSPEFINRCEAGPYFHNDGRTTTPASSQTSLACTIILSTSLASSTLTGSMTLTTSASNPSKASFAAFPSLHLLFFLAANSPLPSLHPATLAQKPPNPGLQASSCLKSCRQPTWFVK